MGMDMDSRTIIEWIGVVMNIVAVVLCVRKSGWCWWAGLVCSGIWIWYGYEGRDLPLMINQVVMVGLNVWGIVRWHKDTGKK